MIDNEASFEMIFDDLNNLRKRSKQDVQSSKALVIWLVMQKDRWPLRLMPRLPCPLLTRCRFEDGAQLRCSSPELFGHCSEPLNNSKCGCAGL
jgi:hypothetical protein